MLRVKKVFHLRALLHFYHKRLLNLYHSADPSTHSTVMQLCQSRKDTIMFMSPEHTGQSPSSVKVSIALVEAVQSPHLESAFFFYLCPSKFSVLSILYSFCSRPDDLAIVVCAFLLSFFAKQMIKNRNDTLIQIFAIVFFFWTSPTP